MLETWVSKDGFSISQYNFIRDDGGHYTVSVMEKDKSDNIFLSIYWVEISDVEFRIIEIE